MHVAPDRAMPSQSAPSPTFIICRPPHPGESLASFVQWHCAENLVPRLAVLLKLLQERCGELATSTRDLAHSEKCLRALEQVTRLPAQALQYMHVKVFRAAVDGGEERRLLQGSHEWSQYSLSQHVQAVCPHCLRESGYAHAVWEYVQAPVCVRHRVQLVDRCPSCSGPIGFNRTSLAHCATCGASLDTAVTASVDHQVTEAARLVQRPRHVAFGTETYTLPVEPQELAGLLRLLLLPKLGRSVDDGLVGNMESLPLERRVDALRHLCSTVVDTRIDAERIRTIALQRWPYAPLLLPDEQTRLLREACQTVGLLPEVSRMICWGTDQPQYPNAATTHGGRPPTIVGNVQLAAHLGIERQALGELLRWERMSPPGADADGFDMDEVSELERVLATMPTKEQVDALLGWPGASSELVSMRLLASFRGANGVDGVHPRSISELFERVHVRVNPALATVCGSASLHEAETLGMDARQFAWAVAQVVGGTLPVHGWEPPFNLRSLQVSQRRLHELADWPQSEASASPALASSAGFPLGEVSV